MQGKRLFVLLKPMDNGSQEIRALDGLRAMAALSIVVFHALGGAGKSALVSKWLAQMAKRNYDGARRVSMHIHNHRERTQCELEQSDPRSYR